MKYIHPDDASILAFAASVAPEDAPIEALCAHLLAWFEANIAYSRLSAPFSPLQRSDLDVLSMRSGTCGDYASLVVSVLTARGFDAQYAYVHRDCYGDAQDHICAAVQQNGRRILIDATQPYRKFHGFDCPHREYELLSPAAFEEKMTAEEEYWLSVARKYDNDLLAGLFYAPWIHSECVLDLPDRREEIFLLLMVNGQMEPTLYAYYQRYTAEKGEMPVMAEVSRTGTALRFSVHPAEEIWDDAQWSDPYAESDIPAGLHTIEPDALLKNLPPFVDQVNSVLHKAGLPTLG